MLALRVLRPQFGDAVCLHRLRDGQKVVRVQNRISAVRVPQDDVRSAVRVAGLDPNRARKAYRVLADFRKFRGIHLDARGEVFLLRDDNLPVRVRFARLLRVRVETVLRGYDESAVRGNHDAVLLVVVRICQRLARRVCGDEITNDLRRLLRVRLYWLVRQGYRLCRLAQAFDLRFRRLDLLVEFCGKRLVILAQLVCVFASKGGAVHAVPPFAEFPKVANGGLQVLLRRRSSGLRRLGRDRLLRFDGLLGLGGFVGLQRPG